MKGALVGVGVGRCTGVSVIGDPVGAPVGARIRMLVGDAVGVRVGVPVGDSLKSSQISPNRSLKSSILQKKSRKRALDTPMGNISTQRVKWGFDSFMMDSFLAACLFP